MILVENKDHITTLTLNQPDQLNALSDALAQEFKTQILKLKTDLKTRVVIVTGAGRAFTSGGNLDMLEAKLAQSPAQNKKELKDFYKCILSVREIPQPVIAAINGPAIGAGLGLALACDLRYAVTNTKLGLGFAKLGLAPGMGISYLLKLVAGPTNAAATLFKAQIFKSEQAYQEQWINDLFSAQDLMPEVFKIAQTIAQNAPLALQAIKKDLTLFDQDLLEKMLDHNAAAQAACFAANDPREGIRAVREKRKPSFTGT